LLSIPRCNCGVVGDGRALYRAVVDADLDIVAKRLGLI
jgi:hypothetical protein